MAILGDPDLFVRKLIIGTLILASTMFVIKGQPCAITCEMITIPNCMGLSYSTTGFPNFFRQTSQDQALAYSAAIPTLLATNCYADTKEFLCGALVPQCVTNTGLMSPTKSMCNDFFTGCGTLIALAGIPLSIDCNMFPETSTAQCLTLPTAPAVATQNGGMTLPPSSNTTGELTNTTTPCTFQCDKISNYECESVPYNYTGFPNIFGHNSMSEVEEYTLYVTIADGLGCYSESTAFLCGVLLPECTENAGTSLPSKTMCEAFLVGCGSYIAQQPGADAFIIDCSIFPDEVNPEPVCYDQPTTPKMNNIITTEKPQAMTTTSGSSTIFCFHSILLLVLSSIIVQYKA